MKTYFIMWESKHTGKRDMLRRQYTDMDEALDACNKLNNEHAGFRHWVEEIQI